MKTISCMTLLLLTALSAGAQNGPDAAAHFGTLSHHVMHKGQNPWRISDYMDHVSSYDALGVHNIRIDLVWNDVEPNPGDFRWNALDDFVNTAMAHNTEVLFTLRSISSWGTQVPMDPNDKYHGASLPKNPADWTDFVERLSSRYAGMRVDYEIENEVNSSFWAGSLADYLDLLGWSNDVIKAYAPHARVLCSAMACGAAQDLSTTDKQATFFGNLQSWLYAILSTHAFDAVSVHDYYFPGTHVVNGQTFSTYLDLTARIMAEAHALHKPVWITEVGYVSEPVAVGSRVDNGSWQKQAMWLKEAHHEAATFLEFKVKKFYWLLLRDNLTIGYFSTMGLEDTNDTQKPSWSIFQQMR